MITPVNGLEVTADGAVSGATGALCGVVLTAGSDAATLVLHDAAAASGIVLVSLKAAANTSVVYAPTAPIAVTIGIYANIGGTNAAAYVSYW